MPQTTLKGYFTPIQPRPVRPVQLPAIHNQKLALVSSAQVSPVSTIERASKTERDLVQQAHSVRTIVEPISFSDTGLDIFIPSGQPQAAIVKVLPSYISRLKSITSTLLPVQYPDKFYNECISDEVIGDLSRVLLWNSQPVGWIRCRLEDDDNGCKQIYVQAIGVLAPYRGYGLATDLLAQVTQPFALLKYNPVSVYCHVWESNEDALEWYEKRGFKRVILLQQYYRRLRPAGAWIMRKELT